MKKRCFKFFITASVLLFLTSCVSTDKMVYFNKGENTPNLKTLQNYEPVLEPGDLLTIHISTINQEAAMPFNLYETAQNYGTPKQLPYLVNAKGEINFPVLGTLKVTGYTTTQLSEHIKTLLVDHLVNPTVNVRLTNFKISVLGDVKSPGVYTVPTERITILEALGLAGDLQIQGKRQTVTLVREHKGERTIATIDLTDKNLFESPYYYLVQNDALYVEPNKTKINSSAVGSNTGIFLSTISTLISLIAIFTR
ncbi:polysaccharide biosynthesis/export family protein [Lutibacter sp. A64]|uniref:polysaccharide biosynthesis/export family protein n=1 Tax=Lutibacter sp. A64 TaxID=2918526 RepID=UPI001F06C470|nr:polysaccharide biosynthesis/export family protein [Lutibacter sp. A64]UMB54369.1 polysaccharide biosynthesis/export family protein [Lutibacter sp. A64]